MSRSYGRKQKRAAREMTPESREILRKWLDEDMIVSQGNFSLKRRRESVTADEVIAECRNDPVVVNRIEMAIAKICRNNPFEDKT